MILFGFLNAHKKAEFRGALFGGYNSVFFVCPGATGGLELGAKVNIKNNFFIIPTFATDYSVIYNLTQYLPIHLLCKIGTTHGRHSGYGIAGGGLVIVFGRSIAPFLNLGGGYEYRKGNVGFFTEITTLLVPQPAVLVRLTAGASFYV